MEPREKTRDSRRRPPIGVSSPRDRGRRIAKLIYFVMLGAIAAAATLQITQQVFFSEPPPDKPTFTTCRDGLIELYGAIERGRLAAERHGSEQTDETALLRYRQTVNSVWQYRDEVAAMCRDSPEYKRALDSIERLRYSEEHSVRSQASELALLRRRARRIMDSVLAAE